ncbi:MAG TPA: metal ABC transporter permease [Ktedonobacterales bacterium]
MSSPSFNIWQDVTRMLQYDFMRQAFMIGGMLSLVAGFIGYFVVLRHQAFAGESLSDVAFTGAIGGAALGINPLLTLLVTTIAVALGMGGLGERLRGRDVAIGTMLAWVLGLGALFLHIYSARGSGSGTGFSGVSILFGNILGIPAAQTATIVWVSVLTLAILAVVARPLLFASLDPAVAAVRGVPVRALGLLFMVLLALTVSEATLAVGALLVFALVLLPAATAQQLTMRPYRALLLGAGIALACMWLGLTLGFYSGLPTSVCVSGLACLGYAAALLWRRYAGGVVKSASM